MALLFFLSWSPDGIFQQMLLQEGEESTQEKFRDCFCQVSQETFKGMVCLPPRTGREAIRCVGIALHLGLHLLFWSGSCFASWATLRVSTLCKKLNPKTRVRKRLTHDAALLVWWGGNHRVFFLLPGAGNCCCCQHTAGHGGHVGQVGQTFPGWKGL